MNTHMGGSRNQINGQISAIEITDTAVNKMGLE